MGQVVDKLSEMALSHAEAVQLVVREKDQVVGKPAQLPLLTTATARNRQISKDRSLRTLA